jgi:hypothetical protein
MKACVAGAGCGPRSFGFWALDFAGPSSNFGLLDFASLGRTLGPEWPACGCGPWCSRAPAQIPLFFFAARGRVSAIPPALGPRFLRASNVSPRKTRGS